MCAKYGGNRVTRGNLGRGVIWDTYEYVGKKTTFEFLDPEDFFVTCCWLIELFNAGEKILISPCKPKIKVIIYAQVKTLTSQISDISIENF